MKIKKMALYYEILCLVQVIEATWRQGMTQKVCCGNCKCFLCKTERLKV